MERLRRKPGQVLKNLLAVCSGLRSAPHQLEYKNVRGLLIETNDPDAVGALEIAPRPEGQFSIPYSEARLIGLTDPLAQR